MQSVVWMKTGCLAIADISHDATFGLVFVATALQSSLDKKCKYLFGLGTWSHPAAAYVATRMARFKQGTALLDLCHPKARTKDSRGVGP